MRYCAEYAVTAKVPASDKFPFLIKHIAIQLRPHGTYECRWYQAFLRVYELRGRNYDVTHVAAES
jgi:hypothetical protein